MKEWSVFRRAAWKVDYRWTASKLLGYSELRRGAEWEPLVKAPQGIVWLDASVAELANCAERACDWEDEYPFFPDWDDDYEPVRLDDEDRRWYAEDRKRNQAREREADVLLVHYLLPHVRLYGKLRALELGERAYFYRLSSALDSLHRCYSHRVGRSV